MPSSAKQIFHVSEEQLTKLAGQGAYRNARVAWERANEIRKTGGRPVCFYSKFSDFTVLDDHDSEPDNVRRLLSMMQRSKPFSG